MDQGNDGLIHVHSEYSVGETLSRLQATIRARGQTIFCRIDHSGEAEKVGLKMPPTQVLIFGSPKMGTPLMLASPTLAIDLPLKVLVWQDTDGDVWVSYNAPEYLKQRHSLPADLVGNISGIKMLVESVARGTEGKTA